MCGFTTGILRIIIIYVRVRMRDSSLALATRLHSFCSSATMKVALGLRRYKSENNDDDDDEHNDEINDDDEDKKFAVNFQKFVKNIYEKPYASHMVVRSEMTFHELCDATGYGANALDDDKEKSK